MKRVVFVNEGSWGEAQDSDYDVWVQTIKRVLEGEENTSLKDGNKKEKVAKVDIVESLQDALSIVNRGQVDTLVFRTRAMLDKAREVKKNHKHLRVVVFTGLVPDDEVILLQKGWGGLDLVRDVCLR